MSISSLLQANSNMHRGLWWTMLPTVQIVFSTPSGVSADLWRWCWQMLCKTTVAAAMGFYDVDIGGFLHLAHNPLVWMVERSWGGARAATGKWQNWAPAQSPAAAAQFCRGVRAQNCTIHPAQSFTHKTAQSGAAQFCKGERAQNWQRGPTLLLSPPA